MSSLSAGETSPLFNHLLLFIWSEFAKVCSIGFLPINVHGIGIMMGSPFEGQSKALLLSLPVAIDKVKLQSIVDPTFEGDRTGNDAPASVKERSIKTILVELNEGWTPYDSSFSSEGPEFHSVLITGFHFLFQLAKSECSFGFSIGVFEHEVKESSESIKFGNLVHINFNEVISPHESRSCHHVREDKSNPFSI